MKETETTSEEVKELIVNEITGLEIGSDTFNNVFAKRLNQQSSRLLKGREYQFNRFVVVPKSERAPQWNGIELLNDAGNALTVGVNTLLGLSVTGKEGAWKFHYTNDVLFGDFSDIVNAVRDQRKIKVVRFDTLDSQEYSNSKTIAGKATKKDFPVFEFVD